APGGTTGGNIPPNTLAAFDLALQEGADNREMDLFKRLDGELFVIHTRTETADLDGRIGVDSRPSEEMTNMRLCNCDLEETFLSVNSYDEILEHYKGKCIMNLDRCINITEDVMRVVRRHNMTDQILLKSDTSEKSLKLIETFA